MTGRVNSVPRNRRTSTRRAAVPALLAIALGALVSGPAQASTEPTGSEARAIKKAFLAQTDGKTKIRKIRVSTVNPRFAAVFYEVQVEPPPSGTRTARSGHVPTKFTPPPVILKQKKSGKWKAVPKAPEKVKKDLKVKDRKSNIVISGDFSAFLTQPASCTDSAGFYSAGIYDPAMDLYLSIQIPQYVGHGWYPARAIGSVAGLYSDSGTVLRYETGQAHDASAPSGDILAEDGWGFIGAGMARTPPDESTESNTVNVTGTWECR